MTSTSSLPYPNLSKPQRDVVTIYENMIPLIEINAKIDAFEEIDKTYSNKIPLEFKKVYSKFDGLYKQLNVCITTTMIQDDTKGKFSAIADKLDNNQALELHDRFVLLQMLHVMQKLIDLKQDGLETERHWKSLFFYADSFSDFKEKAENLRKEKGARTVDQHRWNLIKLDSAALTSKTKKEHGSAPDDAAPAPGAGVVKPPRVKLPAATLSEAGPHTMAGFGAPTAPVAGAGVGALMPPPGFMSFDYAATADAIAMRAGTPTKFEWPSKTDSKEGKVAAEGEADEEAEEAADPPAPAAEKVATPPAPAAKKVSDKPADKPAGPPAPATAPPAPAAGKAAATPSSSKTTRPAPKPAAAAPAPGSSTSSRSGMKRGRADIGEDIPPSVDSKTTGITRVIGKSTRD
jgi:hypothetical protein